MGEKKQRGLPWWLRIVIGSRPRVTLIRVAVLALVSFLVFSYAFRPMLVDGVSMEPTVSDKTFRFANLLVYLQSDPRRGDIVLIDKDTFSSMYMKRILGLPGERVEFRDGNLYVNGNLAPETYLHGKGDWDMDVVRLGSDEYLVAGDNRTVPRRMHLMGVVRRESILGRLVGSRGDE